MNKKVLVVSFTFPPYQDVGARRWTKFCKELFKSGYDVKALTFRFGKASNTANWFQDIETYKEHISYLASRYPRWLENPKSIFDKIMYRLSLVYVKLFTEGNYYDKSSFLRKTVKQQVSKKIAEGYNNIIVSCAPFKLAVWISELKEQYPGVNFIVDFRDPWVDNKVLYGLESMSDKRQKFEVEAEKKVVRLADTVISVADEMTSYFKSLDANAPEKFVTINNGFDNDDFSANKPEPRPEADKNKLKLVFVGSIYVKAQGHVFELSKALDNILREDPELYNTFIFEFYGTRSGEVLSKLEHHSNIRFFGTIPNRKVYQKIMDADGCMTFLTDEITYAFNTKFFEYLSQRKPILIFSKKGSVSTFITDNHIGYALEPGQIETTLKIIGRDFKNKAMATNPAFDISAFDVKNLSTRIENLLK